MVNNIHIYTDMPTAGGSDGTQIDSTVQGSTGSMTVKLNSSIPETKTIKMAVRTDVGYYIDGDCALSLSGANADKWAVMVNHEYDTLSSVDEYISSGGWSSSASLSGVDATNSIFWLKAISNRNEQPSLSGDVGFTASGLVAASVTGD